MAIYLIAGGFFLFGVAASLIGPRRHDQLLVAVGRVYVGCALVLAILPFFFSG